MNKNRECKIEFKLYNPFSQLELVKEIWTSMLKKCPHSYFLSWAWTEIWIESLPKDCNLSLVVGFNDDSVVIAFFLGTRTKTKHRFFKFHQLSLNQTLINKIDDATYIEYNAILIDPKITISLESLLEHLPIKSWDEFRMIRCSSNYQPNLIFNSNLSKKYELNIEKLPSYYVNLDVVRCNKNDYLSLLSQNKQRQIRRSIKEYEKMGEIKVHVAKTAEEALKIFDEYIELYHKRWTERGYPAAMTSEYALKFHKNLISKRFNYGEIQMIKISAGNYTIGCVYDLIYNRQVLFFSCGLNYLTHNVYRPGYVCHYYIVIHNAMNGLSCYDFLEGQHDYKESMSTDQIEIETIIVRKKGMKRKIQDLIVKFYQ